MTGRVIGLKGNNYIPDIGYIWKSANATCPAELYENTTWVQIKDQAILASGDTYALGDTGGSMTVTLKEAEMPTHTHTGSTSSSGEHTHDTIESIIWKETTSRPSISHNTNARSVSTSGSTSTGGTHAHTVTVGSTGEEKAFSIMMPYIVRYMWERIG